MTPRARTAQLVLALALATVIPGAGLAATSADPRGSGPGHGLPSDLPLDRDGIPTRPLSDEELWRLLLALSAAN